MYGDVNLVLVGDLFEALVEVLHVLNQQRSRKGEITFLIFAVVDDMYHYGVLKIGPLDIGQQI